MTGHSLHVSHSTNSFGQYLSPQIEDELRTAIWQMIENQKLCTLVLSENELSEEEDEVSFSLSSESEVASSLNSIKSVITTFNIHNPTNAKLYQMSEHFKNLHDQVPEFQYELEHYEGYREIENHIKTRYRQSCTRLVTLVKSPLHWCALNRELDVISKRPNILEIEMYADFMGKCVSLKMIMEQWMERNNQPEDDRGDNATSQRRSSKCSISQSMVWEMDKINIILERVKYMMANSIQDLTGVDCDLTQEEISEEVGALAKAFLWLVLKDQKRYEQLYPTGEEFDTDEDVEAVSYIDQNPSVCFYCPDVVRCTIPQEIQDYLSGHLTNGTEPKFDEEEIRRKASYHSRADKYIEALTKLWAFVEEASVNIDTHEMIDQFDSSSELPVFSIDDDGNESSTIPDATCETVDTESVSPTETLVSPIEMPVSPTETPVSPIETPVSPIEMPVSPTEMPVSPTEMPVSPTETLVSPTETPVSPTETPVSPTETLVSPAETPISPTETPVSPTETLVSPTETPVSPTETSVSPAETPVSSAETSVSPTETSVSPTETPVEGDVPTGTPRSMCEEVTHAETAADATTQQQKRKKFLRMLVEQLVSQILKKVKMDWKITRADIIVMHLFKITWIQVQGIDFNPSYEMFEKLATAIFKELCKKWDSAELMMSSMKLGEPAFENCFASLIRDHLLTPRRKRSIIISFFLVVGRAIFNIFMCANRVDVM